MGGGDKDGLPTLRRVNQFFTSRSLSRPPVVMLTGEGNSAAREELLKAGASAVLLKPCSVETLRELRQMAESAKKQAPLAPGGTASS